ncbi:TetR/AcrR family transcriptional regulator [Pseudonocardia kujensis]|uniref:TetR/AcrR family transcriptional regulator n=1 Tax=Pseudonocardia kujensis TaxID=1128675 RepID=UPI001E5281E7|nr:TetR/AcrR family transcriptional regulator [Pseudonocardia kujensis]MCE0767884.1 TetR/AcrR family transcriptional regulator [Pseudonocardia kujensis]
MPRLADHDARRAEIVEALWRVLRRDGIAGVSVRTVAAEAGLSPTALRYYFPTQDALLQTAMVETVTSGAARVVPLLAQAADRTGVERMLLELLPVDERQRADPEIYLALAAHARSSPALAAISEETGAGIRRLAHRAVGILAGSGELRADLDVETTACCLDALLQGLIFQGCARPCLTSPEEIRRTLTGYLDQICCAGTPTKGSGPTR